MKTEITKDEERQEKYKLYTFGDLMKRQVEKRKLYLTP